MAKLRVSSVVFSGCFCVFFGDQLLSMAPVREDKQVLSDIKGLFKRVVFLACGRYARAVAGVARAALDFGGSASFESRRFAWCRQSTTDQWFHYSPSYRHIMGARGTLVGPYPKFKSYSQETFRHAPSLNPFPGLKTRKQAESTSEDNDPIFRPVPGSLICLI